MKKIAQKKCFKSASNTRVKKKSIIYIYILANVKSKFYQ